MKRLIVFLLIAGIATWAHAGSTAPTTLRVKFNGYQQLNQVYLFQLFFPDFPAAQQPALKKTGDPVGVGGYTVGAFHQAFASKQDPVTNKIVRVDVSTLDLIAPDQKTHVSLPFRAVVTLPQ